MSIPTYEEVMLPLLRMVSDKKEHIFRDVVNKLAVEFELMAEELEVRLPSGSQRLFDNRVGWAKTYLKKAGLIEQPRRAVIVISQRGEEVLASNPTKIDTDLLAQFSEFQDFQGRDSFETQSEIPPRSDLDSQTPEELLEDSYQQIHQALAQELIAKLKESSAKFFEKVVVDLLIAMGYGGSQADAGRAIGRSGDEGIDGIIKEDRLGLDVIYLQAKRWEGTVGRPEIQKFVGALSGQRARKGVFITTSNFSNEARQYAASLEMKVILIDGDELAKLMIEHGVGASTIASYQIRRIDSDYFEEL